MSGFVARQKSTDHLQRVEQNTKFVPPSGQSLALQGQGEDPSKVKLGASQDSAGVYREGMVYEVPIGRIKSNPMNPRAVYTMTMIDRMATSLQQQGQRIAATGYLDEAGDIVLIEGETRLRGARAGGLPTLRVEVRPKPENERALYEEARAANVERQDQSPLDDALRWKDLLARKVYASQVSLAKALGLGEDVVSRVLQLSNLPNRIIHGLSEKPELLNQRMLNALREYWEATKESEDSTLDLIQEVSKNGLGYRDVVARRKAASRGEVKRPRSTREAIAFKGGKGELKAFDGDGRVELSIKGLKPEDIEELTAKILGLFPKE